MMMMMMMILGMASTNDGCIIFDDKDDSNPSEWTKPPYHVFLYIGTNPMLSKDSSYEWILTTTTTMIFWGNPFWAIHPCTRFVLLFYFFFFFCSWLLVWGWIVVSKYLRSPQSQFCSLVYPFRFLRLRLCVCALCMCVNGRSVRNNR